MRPLLYLMVLVGFLFLSPSSFAGEAVNLTEVSLAEGKVSDQQQLVAKVDAMFEALILSPVDSFDSLGKVISDQLDFGKDAAKNSLVGTIAQIQEAKRVFGNYESTEISLWRPVGRSLCSIYILYKLESVPIVWEFQYYYSRGKWRLIAYKTKKIESIFSAAATE